MSKGPSDTTVAGVIVVIVIVAAIASIGYFQNQDSPYRGLPRRISGTCIVTTSSAASAVISCTKTDCVNVTLPSGAATGPGYSPATITVFIGVNATVVWNNADSTFHTVTEDSSSTLFSSPTMQPGDTFVFNFTSIGPGTYHYHCIFHPPMHGTVIVKPKPQA